METRGDRLRGKLIDEYDVDAQEMQVISLVVSQLNRIDELDAIVERDGLIVSNSQGQRVHPAAQESRQLSLSFARLLATLRIDSEDASTKPAVPRRGVRGVYGVRQ